MTNIRNTEDRVTGRYTIEKKNYVVDMVTS